MKTEAENYVSPGHESIFFCYVVQQIL